MTTAARTTLAALLLVAAAPALAQQGDTPAGGGHLVAVLAGCGSCHNSPDGKPFAGGLVLKTPFGDLAVPNITQDVETGIGGYTYEDFARVVHQGIGKDGEPLYPAMPYIHYTKMSDDDLAALWEYVRTAPPVRNAVEVNRLPFPFSVRQSLWVWRELYFTEGRFEPDAGRDAVWNRGAYLVEALAHCGACHTPRDALGGPIADRPLAGSTVEEWYAPDISDGPDSVIADWSQERLEAFLRGENPGNHVAIGSMHDVVEELAQVPPEDVRAIAAYIKNPPVSQAQAETDADAEPSARAADVALGQQVFAANCVTCHGADGQGAPGVAASLVGAGGVVARRPNNVISVMLQGIAPRETFGAMPPFRESLTDVEIAAAANYVRSAWGNDAPTNARAEVVAGLRGLTQADRKAVAAASCPLARYDRVDAALVDQIAELAASQTADPAKVDAVVAAYRASRPDASVSQTLTDLSGIYCAKLVGAVDAPERVVQHEFAFMQAVLGAATAR